MEVWKPVVGVATWRRGGMELLRLAAGEVLGSGGALLACKRGSSEIRSSGSALSACRRAGVATEVSKAWSSGGSQ